MRGDRELSLVRRYYEREKTTQQSIEGSRERNTDTGHSLKTVNSQLTTGVNLVVNRSQELSTGVNIVVNRSQHCGQQESTGGPHHMTHWRL